MTSAELVDPGGCAGLGWEFPLVSVVRLVTPDGGGGGSSDVRRVCRFVSEELVVAGGGKWWRKEREIGPRAGRGTNR